MGPPTGSPDSTEAYPLLSDIAAYPGATTASGTAVVAGSSVNGSLGDLDVTLETWVIRDSSSNPFVNGTDGSNANALSFVYQLTNLPTSSTIEAFDLANWGTALTDVGYYTSGGSDPNDNPLGVSRSGPPTDNFINWSFAGAYAINAGEQSDLLIINTNSNNYTTVSASVQDGVNLRIFSDAAFAPGAFLSGAVEHRDDDAGTGGIGIRRSRPRPQGFEMRPRVLV